MSRIAEITQVDAFLARPKFLQGPPPEWAQGSRTREMQMIWNIEDDAGIVSGNLRLVWPRADGRKPSVSLVWRSDSIWRVDIEDPGVCHSNPHDAYLYDLPPDVCGSHSHSWPINRDYVLNTPHIWSLPYRCHIPVQVRKLDQAVHWLADQINLTLGPDQHIIEMPPQTDLLG